MDVPFAAFGLFVIVVALLGAFAELYGADTRPDFTAFGRGI